MGSVSNGPNGISYLLPLFSNTSSGVSSENIEQILDAASPADAVQLSTAAVQAQEVDGLFGLTAPQSQQLLLPGMEAGPALASGVSSSDVTNATPAQQAEIAQQTQALNQVQNLFNPQPTPSAFNILA